MLIELRVRDYAVIDDLSLTLGAGLNVLSGETGAGKSIIVGALSLLVGERASSQAVRKGAGRAAVEAVFDISQVGGLREVLDELGFALDEDLLILRREVASEGRNRAWVNGSPATASLVGDLGARLVDIHGQHEHQSLLKRSAQRAILDIFADAEQNAQEVATLHGDLTRVRLDLRKRLDRLAELEDRADFLRFQLEEIENANIRIGEETDLEEEARRLEHAEDLAVGASELHEGLYSGDDSLSDRVASLQELLSRLAKMDPTLQPLAEALKDSYHLLAETGQRLGSYASTVEFEPARLDDIRARQDLLFRLKRKYGPELEDVLNTAERVRQELSELDVASFDLEELRKTEARIQDAFLAAIAGLSERRELGASRLEDEVQAVLPELGLEGGRFVVKLRPVADPGAGGGEEVEFLVTLNPGFDPGPLSKIASGGELSRVMLALKAVLAAQDQVPTLIFDEIDAGIGGEVALRVAEKLREVALSHQVFVITHLPQLASKAHHQLLVEKEEVDGMPSTGVRELGEDDRVREVARMLGGDPESVASRTHARELLGLS